MARSDDLSRAAEEGLDGPGEPQSTEPMIPACRVKFEGMSWDSLEEVPALKDQMAFRVEGMVTKHTVQIMKDGEIREVAGVTVEKIERIPVDE